MNDQERIKELEAQIKLLWAALLHCPRLEGIHDTVAMQSLIHKVKPLRFEDNNER